MIAKKNCTNIKEEEHGKEISSVFQRERRNQESS